MDIAQKKNQLLIIFFNLQSKIEKKSPSDKSHPKIQTGQNFVQILKPNKKITQKSNCFEKTTILITTLTTYFD